jgi:type IV pilus assembly protein PilY1
MSDVDVPSTQTQTIYAFRDGTVSAPNTTSTFPLDRSSLAQMANPVAGVTPTANGWYMDLTLNPGASGSPAERVVNTPTANEGFIGWVTQKPTDDPCAPGVVSYAYLLEYATGKTRLVDSSGNWTNFFQAPTANGFLLEWVFLRGGEGRMRAIVSASSGGTLGGGPSGKTLGPPQKLGILPGTPARLQWRDVQQ